MKSYIIGLDNGTTGAKAKLYDLQGNVINESYQEYTCSYPKPGWVDQDIHVLMEANYSVLRDLIDSSNVNPDTIASLGLSTQRGLHLYIDEDGKVLRNGMGISWQDTRHPKQIEWMRNHIGEKRFYEITGLPIGAFWPIGKIRWVMENEPQTIEKAHKIISTQEYFLHELGARDGWYVDWSNGSLFGLMDVKEFEWSKDLLQKTGISNKLMPSLVPSATKVGEVDKRCHERTGLPIGLPLCTGGGDQQCAGIGAGVVKPGLCEFTFGTAGNSVAFLDKPNFDPSMKITCSAHALPTPGWEAEGIQAAAGGSYRWFRDTIGYMAKYIEPFTQMDPYSLLNNLAEKAPIGSNGLLFNPYLAGSMTPHYDSHAKGSFVGLALKHDTSSLARSVLEGVSFEAKDTINGYANMGLDLTEIRLAGGATNSPLWCQIQADVYGRPTRIMREGECAVLGAAILGAVGAGVFDNVEEACEQMVHPMETFEPDPKAHEIYNELHKIYQGVYSSLADSGVYEKLTAFQDKYA